jgi:hypothetical protein
MGLAGHSNLFVQQCCHVASGTHVAFPLQQQQQAAREMAAARSSVWLAGASMTHVA